MNKTFEEERAEYISRFGVEPPKCQACNGLGSWEGWDYAREMEIWKVCEFCDGNGYHTTKTPASLIKSKR